MTLWDGLFDVHCVGCRTWGTIACDACVRQWTAARGTSRVVRGVSVYALGRYSGGLRRAVLAAKHGGARGLVSRLGPALTSLIVPCGPVLAIPVPSSRPGYRARGFGLASTVAHAAGLRIVNCLRLDDGQSQRGRRGRERLNRHMVVNSDAPPPGTRVVIVDDVITTGASAAAAIDACQRYGIRVVGCLVIASAETSATRAEPLSNFTNEV